MFVGQDWGDVSSLAALTEDSDSDMKAPTARELVTLLEDVGLPLRQCFFTNALFGAHQTGSDVGRSPGWSSPAFVERCADALWLQIQHIQPRVMVCLGQEVPRLLVHIFPGCAAWIGLPFTTIDSRGDALLRLTPPIGPVRRLVILLHPCYRKPNLHLRSYKGQSGHAAEVQLLTDSL
jgi:uracil-DNA glycosylase